MISKLDIRGYPVLINFIVHLLSAFNEPRISKNFSNHFSKTNSSWSIRPPFIYSRIFLLLHYDLIVASSCTKPSIAEYRAKSIEAKNVACRVRGNSCRIIRMQKSKNVWPRRCDSIYFIMQSDGGVGGKRGGGANKKEIVAPGEGWPEGEGCRNVVVNAPRFLSPLFRDGWKSHRVRGKRVTCLSLFSFDYYYLLSQRNCPST